MMTAGNALKLQILLNAVDRVSGPLNKILRGSRVTARALRATQGQLKQLNTAQRQLDGFRALHTGVRQTASAMAAAQSKVAALAAKLEATTQPSKRLNAEFKDAARLSGLLKTKHATQQRELQTLRDKLAAAGISTRNLSHHEHQLRSEVAAVNRTLEQQHQRLNRLAAASRKLQTLHRAGMKLTAHGAGALATGTLAARGLGTSVAAFATQEDAAMQLRAAMMTAGGKIGPEFAKIDALAQTLGNRLPGTTADFYAMMTMLQRQGMSAQAILGGLGEATAYLGVQLKMGYPEAAEFAAKLQDATRTSEGDMMALSDVIQRTFYLGVDADNMLQGFSKLTSAMDLVRSSGLDAARMFAPLLVIADQAGMQGEAAGNAYRKMFQAALDTGKLAKANALLKGSGIRLDFSDGKGEFGGLDPLFAQLDKLKKLSTQDRLTVIKKLFGDDAETLQVVALMINKGAAGYAQVQAKMARQASLQARVNGQLGTLRNLWEAAAGTFVNALAVMGEAVAPELKTLTQWLGVTIQP